MPIYEYQCESCKQKARKFWRTFAEIDESSLECPRCGEHNFQRLISRVAFIRSEDARLENLADPASLAGLDEDDPKSIARWMRKMSQEVGEEMPSEFDEVIDRLESGQSPEEIEKSMPELAEGLDGMGGMGGMGGNEFVDL
ncbi:MAG: zinc ribbon domain-containing protein [Anaerolineae bacterium]|nr:zinc ribbon domain-containing protein [Anaerolineae bacterium]